MRQRDVEQMIRKYGHERGSFQVMMRLAEEIDYLQRNMKDMAEAFAAITQVVTMQNTVADKMKDKIDAVSRHFDDDPRSTRAIVTSTDPEDN